MEFGREALAGSEKPCGPKPATFDFLGLTHICKRSRKRHFTIHVRRMRKRLRRSLKAVTEWCREHRHYPVDEQQEALNRKLRRPPGFLIESYRLFSLEFLTRFRPEL